MCGGNEICQHNRRKSECKECHGVSICEHDHRCLNCKICLEKKCIHEFIAILCSECNK